MLVSVALASVLGGCESNQERSARIDAHGHEQIAGGTIGTIRVENPTVKVRRAVIVRGAGGGSAAAIELRTGGRAQANVPVQIDVRDAHGRSVYRNDTVGLQPSLQHLALIPPGRSVWWVDDQLLGATAPASVRAHVGTAQAIRRVPHIALSGVHFETDAAGTYLTGTVHNRSHVLQRDVPVFAVAQRGDRVVAAGRALVPKLPATPGPKSVHFRLLFVGSPSGAKVTLTVAPTAVS